MSVSVPQGWGDPDVIPTLIAQDISNHPAGAGLTVEYLSNAVVEVTPETQTLGAALLQIQLADPLAQIANSGICTKDQDGFLPAVDVEFPHGTGVWWRLAMVDFSTDPATPLTLTFQMRIVAYLQQCIGGVSWPSGQVGTTRAQFIKMLVDRMPKELSADLIGPGQSKVTFICPELNEVQPVASTSSGSTQVLTSSAATNVSAQVNKQPGLTYASAVTIKGVKPTRAQVDVLNTLLGVGQQLSAPAAALQAIVYAAMGESGVNPYAPGGGVLQGTSFPNPTDVAGEANAFFLGTNGFGNGGFGGAIAAAQAGHPVWVIANSVEDNAVWIASKGDSYGHQWPGGQAQGLAEAQAIVNAFNGGQDAGVSSSASDVAQLQRGTSNNPSEDSWTCMQRLASEVNWMLFTSPQPSRGVWGNYLYFIDGPTLVSQQPSLTLTFMDGAWQATDTLTGKTVKAQGNADHGASVAMQLSGTIDNTSALYESTRKAKGKSVKKTRIRTPQTPSILRFNLLAGVLEFNAGDVFAFQGYEPANGRWIVEDVTHNSLAEVYAQFTLGPPTFPYPEPQGTGIPATTAAAPSAFPTPSGKGGSGDVGTPANVQSIQQRTLTGVAQAALLAASQQSASGGTLYVYQEVRPFPVLSLFAPPPRVMDCSQFTTLAYRAAGLPDPNHLNYDGQGNTSTLIAHATHLAGQGEALPGDMCFFGTSAQSTVHVNVYVGNNQCVNMGSRGEPKIIPAGSGPSTFLGYYRSDVAPTLQGVSNALPGAAPPKSGGSILSGPLGGIFTSPFNKG
jgi:hypothetical protein